jgi:hypothetical protein
MNLKPGGKQPRLRNSIIPCNDPFIPEHLCGLPQSFCYSPENPNPKLAGQSKRVQAILEERGLWQNHTALRLQEGKPSLNLQCKECKTSNVKEDTLICSAKLIQQAKECGYFLTKEQCVAELIASSENTQDPVSQSSLKNNNKASTLDSSNHSSTSSINCCWSKILLQQSDFLSK